MSWVQGAEGRPPGTPEEVGAKRSAWLPRRKPPLAAGKAGTSRALKGRVCKLCLACRWARAHRPRSGRVAPCCDPAGLSQLGLRRVIPPCCSVLDAAFLCWALDRDANTVTVHKEVYDAFCALPLKPASGAVVEGPDGRVLYGAELAVRRAQPPASPSADQQQRQPLLAGRDASAEMA